MHFAIIYFPFFNIYLFAFPLVVFLPCNYYWPLTTPISVGLILNCTPGIRGIQEFLLQNEYNNIPQHFLGKISYVIKIFHISLT